MSGYPVENPSERAAGVVFKTILDISNIRQVVELPTGAKWVAISYMLLPGATAVTGQYIKAVFNAASNDHADGLMTLPDSFLVIFQGAPAIQVAFENGSLCTRLDLQAAAAVGAEKTIVRIVAGV